MKLQPKADYEQKSWVRIQSGKELSDGGDLVEPVEARLLCGVIHIFNCEIIWGGKQKSNVN